MPRLHVCSASYANDIGVPYILMSKAPGTKLSAYNWPWFSLESSSRGPSPLAPLPEEGKFKVMHQLGIMAAQLSRLQFSKIGSLHEIGDNMYTIKECLSPSHTCYKRDTLPIDRGPFCEESAYYESLVSAHFMHARELPMGAHCFVAPLPVPDDYAKWEDYKASTSRWNDFMAVDNKPDHSSNRLDYCIASQLAQGMIPSLPAPPVQRQPSRFPLRHFHLSLNNIFVDHDWNITCVIDWAFASSVPAAELLAPPGLPYPRIWPGQSLAATYRRGFEQHTGQMQQWEGTETLWYFQRFLSMDSYQDYHYFDRLCSLATKNEERPADTLRLFTNARENVDSEVLGRPRCGHVPANSTGQNYFSNKSGTDREAVARKLMVMMELNHSFVADCRLWRWIREAIDGQ